ncbi:YolD-like family protein [Paenibacillus macquariensis]|uniref:YolD-like family protein n=1 Tax=Paenibacillus macquariensis TaxID=948756 RepID=UPI0007C2193A|nr:YolD-like family protein [Paenibacillus macquariensis]MEC0092523.1 YolD-like family protein [Paenibacillus macquariensis]OAB35479.1 hypothetical protein PMSM_09495 [Paenibacillus macquariensis subsp. macquariensis]
MNAIPKPSGKSKVSRPTRDEFDLQELAEKLGQSLEGSTQLVFTIWKSSETAQGTVTKMDTATQRVHIQTRYEGLLKIPFIDILKAESLE